MTGCNRLTQDTTEDGKAVSYRYNGDNLMVESTENGVTTHVTTTMIGQRLWLKASWKVTAASRLPHRMSMTITASCWLVRFRDKVCSTTYPTDTATLRKSGMPKAMY
jgi:YD repeat-containing protein